VTSFVTVESYGFGERGRDRAIGQYNEAMEYSAREGPQMSRPRETVGQGNLSGRVIMLIVMGVLLGTTMTWAAMGFDERYERDYNIYTPTNRYAPNNPLNPVNKHDPNSAFNPINRYDPGNPTNPINQYNPNNPFNSINQYYPENPLNPANKYNSSVPFGPLDGIVPPSK